MSDDQIIFAIQDWNEEYKWWHPNTVPLDFVLNGKKTIPATHEFQWFNHNNFSINRPWDEEPDLLWQYPACNWEYLTHHPGVKYTLLKDIEPSKKYIYPIIIKGLNYFEWHEQLGFDLISERVLTDVKNNIAKIVLFFPLEGFSGSEMRPRDFEILNSWCIKKNLTKDQVYYIHGNFKVTDAFSNYNFTYIPISAFPFWFEKKIYGIPPFKPVNSKNLFLTYNRRWDRHRSLLVLNLVKNNLLNRGLISYLGYGNSVKKEFTETFKLLNNMPHRRDLIPVAEKLETLKEGLRLDFNNLEDNNPVTYVVEAHHQSTFLFICTETMTCKGTVFFSEKTWKPITAGQPFLMLSNPGALHELKKLGYKTFDKWWSEEYDNEENLDKRVDMIIDIIINLSEKKVEDLIALRKEIEPVLIHNQDLFNTLNALVPYKDGKVYNDEYQHQAIRKIWDSF